MIVTVLLMRPMPQDAPSTTMTMTMMDMGQHPTSVCVQQAGTTVQQKTQTVMIPMPTQIQVKRHISYLIEEMDPTIITVMGANLNTTQPPMPVQQSGIASVAILTPMGFLDLPLLADLRELGNQVVLLPGVVVQQHLQQPFHNIAVKNYGIESRRSWGRLFACFLIKRGPKCQN